MSFSEINSHVIMCAQEQSATSTLKSTKSLKLSSPSRRPLPKRGAKRKRSQHEKKISQAKINVVNVKRRKRMIDRDENMKLRYESVESLKKDDIAKRAMELILLDYLS